MSLLVAITGWDSGGWKARFAAGLPDRDVVTTEEDHDPAAVRYVCAWKPPSGTFDGLTNLQAVFSLGAGVDHLLRHGELPDDVPLVRMVDDSLTLRMSEWVCLHILMHHRQQRLFDRQQRERLWREHTQPVASAIRVGIMGLGVLGQDAARKLTALGYTVAGWSRTAKEIAGVDCFAGESELTAFLARTDILVVLLPDTPDTRGILNRDLFGKLARDSVLPEALPVLINAGRGALQVEADIIACLDDGTLKGATLDVFETEPLPADNPLWSHPLVTVTPHVSADSQPDALAAAIVRQIRRHEAGEALENVVDRARGY